MPVFQLDLGLAFPDPALAEPDGLLAVGGDLCPERLLMAYERGIFPWFNEDDPLLWWSPPQRMILWPGRFVCTKSLQSSINRRAFTFTMDSAFSDVIRGCAGAVRKGTVGTWITPAMSQVYNELHRMGLAHSIEVWSGSELVGGLYGVSLGRAFFGESMFSKVSDASKAALMKLDEFVVRNGFHFTDCQLHTSHLESLGAVSVSRDEYLAALGRSLAYPDMIGTWKM